MKRISIIIAYINQKEITEQCINNIVEFTDPQKYELILINNGSDKETWNHPKVPSSVNYKTLHFGTNQGLPLTLYHGMKAANGEIICMPHNDTLIWEKNWEDKVWDAFEENQLGMAGFFGAMQLGQNGGRADCYSNLQGRVWGARWSDGQSGYTDGVIPAATLDGLCLMFNKSILERLNDEQNFLSIDEPLHHFFDRDWTVRFIDAGFRVGVIGVACDHRGGSTANVATQYHDTARKWLMDRNIQIPNGNADLGMYLEAERRFLAKWQDRLPLVVDHQFNYKWTN